MTPQEPHLPNYAAAVRDLDSALVNLLLTEIRDVRYFGLMVYRQAEVYAAALSVNTVSEVIKRATATYGGDAVFANSAKALQLNGFKLVSASRGGLVLVGTQGSVQNGILAANTYGIVERVGNMNAPDYDFKQCVLTAKVDYLSNETPYMPDGDLPVPNKPLPVPCFDSIPACKSPPPPPAQETLPALCPVVRRL